MDQSVQENILSAPASAFENLEDDFVSKRNGAEKLIACFERKGDYRPRKVVEADSSRVQALPVVVVRNSSGEILLLTRKERDSKNHLHKKMAVWAGGHVRREDARKGSSIPMCALRELQEELRLFIPPNKLKLLGAVYVASSGESTKKHMAFVYEWRAPTNDVQIALCNSEFFEKAGTSLAGEFVSADKVSEQSEKLEDWSKTILDRLILQKPRAKARVAHA